MPRQKMKVVARYDDVEFGDIGDASPLKAKRYYVMEVEG